MPITIHPCPWNAIADAVRNHYRKAQITVDSYWEKHVLGSQHYRIERDGVPIGFFAIHGEHMLTLFHVIPEHADQAQVLFERIKRYEQVTNAFIPTGDEFFLSHAIDNFSRLEKQAYFSIYTDKAVRNGKRKHLSMKRARTEEDVALFDLTGDFFDNDEATKILIGTDDLEVYLVYDDGVHVGFGVVEYGLILPENASIGMFVFEEHRQKGYAASILKTLQEMMEDKNKTVLSGCWYYNHNSKKSMESAGAYSKTRLLRFYF